MIPAVGEVAQTDAAMGRAFGSVFRLLPPVLKVAVMIIGLLAGMTACSVAWVDHREYAPAPNICRVDQVPTSQVPCQVVPR